MPGILELQSKGPQTFLCRDMKTRKQFLTPSETVFFNNESSDF